MSVSRTKQLLVPLFIAGLALPVFAQNSTDSAGSSGRDASFLTPEQAAAPQINVPAFSGLATEPPALLAPPTAQPATQPPTTAPQANMPVTTAPAAPSGAAPAPVTAGGQPADKPAEIVAAPVATAPLPDVSPESVGTQGTDSLGAGMWKGTPMSVATALLSITAPTASPALNDLARRLLKTAAVPPEGKAEGTSLTSLRVQKLAAFGAAQDAWTLAKNADPKLIDDATFHDAAENMLAADGEDLCGQMAELAKTHNGADWQKDMIICQLRAKDLKAASVALDVMRAQSNRDTIFLEIADKNILVAGKNLPFQLTPVTAANLALLRLAGLPLPGEIYGHPDTALVPALMHTTAKQDVAQLGLAEHAAERGLISNAELAAVYRSITFTSDELPAPLTAHETGLRQHALLFQAAANEKDTAKRIAYTVYFVRSVAPSFLNGTGALLGEMLGSIKAEPTLQENAATVAWIYMLAGRGDAALDWLRLARSNNADADELQKLWPQFALAGLEAESDYNADFDKWLTAALVPASAQEDPRVSRDAAASVLLLLDAAGFKVPETAWAKVIAPSHNEKHIAPSALLLDRVGVAGAAGRRAEAVLMAVGLAGDKDISLPAAVAITRTLREVGLKSEAALFARQIVALPAKQN